MTRLGWLLLLAFAIVIGGFYAVSRSGREVLVSAETPKAAPLLAPRPATGQLVIPVSGVQPDQLTDTWGDARGDGTRAHHAIDILAPRGTPVVAAAGGRIEKIFESKAGGHTVYVGVDPATIHYYAHLDAYAPGLAEGQALGQGVAIGTVGSTGDASAEAPHLHFEIKHMAPGERWWQGTEIDPYPILAGR